MFDLTQFFGFSAMLKSRVPYVYGLALPVRLHQRRCGKKSITESRVLPALKSMVDWLIRFSESPKDLQG
jgi:hypothetical protein